MPHEIFWWSLIRLRWIISSVSNYCYITHMNLSRSNIHFEWSTDSSLRNSFFRNLIQSDNWSNKINDDTMINKATSLIKDLILVHNNLIRESVKLSMYIDVVHFHFYFLYSTFFLRRKNRWHLLYSYSVHKTFDRYSPSWFHVYRWLMLYR